MQVGTQKTNGNFQKFIKNTLQISHYVLQTFNLSNNNHITKGDKTAFTLLKMGLETATQMQYQNKFNKSLKFPLFVYF